MYPAAGYRPRVVRRPLDTGWALTRQPAHAGLAADLAAALSLEPMGPPDGFALAVRHHDDGWEERDREVREGPAGAPETFLDLPLSEHVAIARRSVARATSLDPYAGALVARYAAYLHGGRPVDDEGDRALRDRATAAWESLAAGLIEGVATPVAVDRDLALLAALDRLSLWLCGWPDEPELALDLSDGRVIVFRRHGDVVSCGVELANPAEVAVGEALVGDVAPFTVRERRTRTITLVAGDG